MKNKKEIVKTLSFLGLCIFLVISGGFCITQRMEVTLTVSQLFGIVVLLYTVQLIALWKEQKRRGVEK